MEKPISSRRSFIAKTSLAVVGTTLLTSASSFATIIGETIPFKGYRPTLEFNNDLRTLFSEKTLKISGTLFTSESNLEPCANATIEVWHLSPNSKEYNHKGKFMTDENGTYTFYTDFPNRKEGFKPRVFFKVTAERKTVFTELVIDTHQTLITHKHWEQHNKLGEYLFPIYKPSNTEGTIQFNFIIN